MNRVARSALCSFLAASIATVASSAPRSRTSADSGQRMWLAEIALVGPLEAPVLDVGAAGRTVLSGSVQSGESRTLIVPLSARDRGEPRTSFSPSAEESPGGTGSMRFLGWKDEGAHDRGVLPSSLLARPRPTLRAEASRSSPALCAMLVAAFVIAMTLRRRAILAPSFAVLSSLLIFAWISRESGGSTGSIVVYEGDGADWIVVEAALDRLLVAPMTHADLIECDPTDAVVDWHVSLDEREDWEARAPGARLDRIAPLVPGPRRFRTESNEWATLIECWVREDGEWRALGKWEVGTPLPSRQATGIPPAWLATGLPQGPRILLGRFADGGSRGRTFVRLAGF